jgi:DNA-binding response OmpR family regulator
MSHDDALPWTIDESWVSGNSAVLARHSWARIPGEKVVTETHQPTTVLLVEDNTDFAEMLALVLESDGYRVHRARDAFEALAFLNRFKPAVAIIDVGLPRMDGYQLAMRVRRTATCALIAVSGQEPSLKEPEASAFDAYLMKPVDIARLRSSIVQLARPPLERDTVRQLADLGRRGIDRLEE